MRQFKKITFLSHSFKQDNEQKKTNLIVFALYMKIYLDINSLYICIMHICITIDSAVHSH